MTIRNRSPLAWRLALLGSAFLLLPGSAASLALFALTTAGIPTILAAGVGIVILVVAVWFTRRLADAHRFAFARLLDVKIPRPYRPRTGGRGQRMWAVARDPASWRDFGWLLLNGTIGLTAYVLVITLFGGFLWYASLPLLWRILTEAGGPDVARDVLRTDFGVWAIDSQTTAFAGLAIGLLWLLLWWWLSPLILRGYALLSRTLLAPTGSAFLAQRVAQLTESRAEAIDTQAAELRRIERDLHDGAQAWLVSLGMSLGMAEEMIRTDPEGAARLLAEAKADSGQALTELRDLVRGIHPPVLADRGLPGAVQALALAHPLPVTVVDRLPGPGRLPAPVESAAYFAIAEVLTNVAKHARASRAGVRLGYHQGRLRVTVDDDGEGGATATTGGGLRGVHRRLSAFDGTVSITSPPGGPTVVTMEIPCELSSAKTMPSSGTG